jgi:alpha-maltose-1-phosphate synthase
MITMKILLINLNIKGGMVHYISQLANALAKNNNVYVIAQKGTDTQFFNTSVNLIELDAGNTKKNFILNTILIHRMSKFLDAIYKINPDVIHLQSCHLWICFFLPFLSKYRIVTTIHDVTPHVGSRFIDQEISRKIHIKYSNALIVHGQNAKEILSKESRSKDIYVVPHGDYSFFTNMHGEKQDEEPFSILFFGRIEAYKGLTYLIQAVPLIADKIPNVKVIIAGSGDFVERKLIENSSFFEIHNYFINDRDVGKYFQRASIVALPYIECTQTGIIPIAYAFKKPVVVTNVGSIPEVVDEGVTGYVVPPKDPKAIADAIVKILKDDKLKMEMGENAYKKMKEELSWDIVAEKTKRVYQKVIGFKHESN